MIILTKYYFVKYRTKTAEGYRLIGVPFFRSAMYAHSQAVESLSGEFVITEFKRV